MIRHRLTTIILLLSVTKLFAQNIALDFPHFASQEWYMTAFRGDGKDTIATGQLDAQGKAMIILPDTYKNHRGMTQWLLRNGGGLDIILSGAENISVSCPEAQPSEETIKYSNTAENNYLRERYARQQQMLAKVDAMRMATEAYKGEEGVLLIFRTELKKQEAAYDRLQHETAANSLYAARFAQIVDVTRGLPPTLSQGNENTDLQIKDFIIHGLDMQALYTSGHWQGVLSQWLDWYIHAPENEALLKNDYQILKKRISDTEIAVAFDATVQKALTQKKRNDLIFLTSNPKAPALSQGQLLNKKTILVFYESGCGPCENEMQQLKGNYELLRKKGYEVISISADRDQNIYRNTSETFPWKEKYCDLQGVQGRDFVNYGVNGTPTMFMIDEKGIIMGIYARLGDMKLDK